MSIKAEQIADKLKKQADKLLFNQGIDKMMRKYGSVEYTGSYALDLMAWEDIDLYLIVPDSKNFTVELSMLAQDFMCMNGIKVVKFETSIHERIPSLPVGLYLGVKIQPADRDSLWKLDIWVVSESERLKNKLLMAEIKNKLTDKIRTIILNTKQSLMTPDGRTPSMSSYHIYQAVLVHGLRNKKDIREYLVKQNVQI